MTTSPLYETDFYTWTQIQAQALRAKDWAVLDVEHLAEEIESLGRSERFAIERQMERLLLHLLKWRYDPAERPRRGWRLTMFDARGEIAKRATGGLREHPKQVPERVRTVRVFDHSEAWIHVHPAKRLLCRAVRRRIETHDHF